MTTNRYKEEQGDFLVQSVNGKGSLVVGSYLVECEMATDTPEGWWVKLIIKEGKLKNASHSEAIKKEAIEGCPVVGELYDITVGFTDGLALKRTASGFFVCKVEKGEFTPINDSPLSLDATISLVNANPSSPVVRTYISKMEPHNAVSISKETQHNSEDTSLSADEG